MPQTHIHSLPMRARTGLFARLRTAFVQALSRRHDRQRLGKLDAHLMRDIGLEAQDVHRESAKPFWQP